MPDWNEKQQEVLDSLVDHRDILVSAAAGSGKTAVLVQRIIDTVEKGLADINEILVVTFTKPAAAQMREKIIKALENLAAKDATGRMGRQLILAEKADITTIDSFCNRVVRENFSVVDMDPSFDMYDKNEEELLKDTVLTDVLDRYYKNSTAMKQLSKFLFVKNINDETIRETVLKVHRISQSFAVPEEWLQTAGQVVGADLDVGSLSWVEKYKEYMNCLAQEHLDIIARMRDMFEGHPDPDKQEVAEKVLEVLTNDKNKIEEFIAAETLEEKKQISNRGWSSLPNAKIISAFGEAVKGAVADRRDKYKSDLKKVFSEDDIAIDLNAQIDFIVTIVDIVRDFEKALLAEKKKNKKYAFNDIAHAAFNILYDKEADAPSVIGQRKSKEYKFIYIDEYQDSSDLQERLLSSIAERDDKGNTVNMFMVGDVKQSIYAFRMARPDIFNDKSKRFETNDGGRLICLNMNYRSREEILKATNYIFECVMTPFFGGVTYNDEVALHTPKEDAYKDHYPDTSLNAGGKPVVTIIDKDIESDNTGKYTPDELVAINVGHRILEIVNGDKAKGIEPAYVLNESFDKNSLESDQNPRYRKAEYGDIVILQRGLKRISPMLRIYEQMGIPLTINDNKGYFDAMEIVTLISVLRIVDNIQQDIPYASALISHMGGLSDEDLARVVGLSTDYYASLADKCRIFAEGYVTSEDEVLRDIAEKLESFNGLLDKWSRLLPYLSIADLIDRILEDTDYEAFVAAMPDGKRRVDNIRKLGVYARNFENGRNAGLLDFLRYIDKCQIHGWDMAESNGSMSAGNTVRLMTIHGSKGLEFPIVIIPKINGGFKYSEKIGKTVSVSQDYYLTLEKLRILGNGIMTRRPSVKAQIVSLLENAQTRAEEARLLYVAMTRAKEKLYMVGIKKKFNEIPMLAESFNDFVFQSMAISKKTPEFDLEMITIDDVVGDFEKRYIKRSLDYTASVNELMKKLGDKIQNDTIKYAGEINPYDYEYEYQDSTKYKSKKSVSEIKHAEMEKASVIDVSEVYESDSILESRQEETVEPDPEAKRRAALRGTVTHSIFEKINYDVVVSRDTLKAEMERILADDFYSEEERGLINVDFLLKFYSDDESSLFRRMKKAYGQGKLHRERQFIAGLSLEEIPGEIVSKISPEDYVVIQGIIDAYFYEGEDDDIILVDYKTDKVEGGEALLKLYASQMYIYALTLEKLTGHKVADCILYSTRFGEVHYPQWRDYLNKDN